MKLQLVARPGHAPVAVLVEHRGLPTQDDVAAADSLARRLLGREIEFCDVLSERWRCLVFGTREFVRWWRAQDKERRPDRADVIFLEVLNG